MCPSPQVLSLVLLARPWLQTLYPLPFRYLFTLMRSPWDFSRPHRLLSLHLSSQERWSRLLNIFMTLCWTSAHPSLSSTGESKTGHSFPGMTSPGLNKEEGSSPPVYWQDSNTPNAAPDTISFFFFAMQLCWFMFNLLSSGTLNSKSRLQI